MAGNTEKQFLLRSENFVITFNIEMLSENWKILLDYKSEGKVTKHCLNGACVLVFEN